MTLSEAHPIHYLTPYRPGFWGWDQGEIAFVSGKTLTFREELFAVVQHLQPYGLPPVESLLLFLAATRDPWGQTDGLAEAWHASVEAFDPIMLARHLPDYWKVKVRDELDKVRALDSSWRKDIQKKCLLAEVCFEQSKDLGSPDKAQAIADLLELGFVAPSPPPEAEAGEAVRRLAEVTRATCVAQQA